MFINTPSWYVSVSDRASSNYWSGETTMNENKVFMLSPEHGEV